MSVGGQQNHKLPHSADVVIIGAGIMGCAAAYFLANRGLSVVLLDKSRVAGQQSSRALGFVRAQARDPVEVPLMIESLRIWRGLEAELNADLEWRESGCLYLANDETQLAMSEAWLETARQHGLPTRLLSPREVTQIVPTLANPAQGGLFTPNDGQAEPRKVTPAFAKRARELGARILEGCGATGIELSAGRVISGVATEAGNIRTRTVICAAGASSFRILRSLGLTLPQQHVRYTVSRTNAVAPITSMAFLGHGICLRQRPDGSLNLGGELSADVDLALDRLRASRFFLRAIRDSHDSFTFHLNSAFLRDLALRLPWMEAARQPWIHDRDPIIAQNDQEVRRAFSTLRRTFPEGGHAQAVESWAGHIDCLPDGIPVIDAIGEPQGLIIATGFCGHGMGLGPVVGRLLTELVTDGRTSLNLREFRFSRYAEGDIRKPYSIY